MESKSLFTSVTFWGLIVTFLSQALKHWGIQVDEAGLSNDLVSLSGLLVAGYGRFRATQPLHFWKPGASSDLPPDKPAGFVKIDVLAALGALSLAVGCAQFGLAPAKSFDQQVGYAYATVASVRQSAANMLEAGQLKVADAQQVQTLADQARSGLDLARQANASGDTQTAFSRLQLANNVLLQIQQYLQTRQKP